MFTFKWEKKPTGTVSLSFRSHQLKKYEITGDHLVRNTSVFNCNLAVMFSI